MAIYRTAVRHQYTAQGGPGYNIWHFRTTLDQGPQSPILQAAADALEAFYTACNGLFPTVSQHIWDGEWSQVDGDQYLPPADPWTVVGFRPATDGYAPTASAMCVTWRTESNTAAGRGRTFLSPVSGAILQSDGTPNAESLTSLRAAAAGLVQEFAGPEPGDEGGFGVYSRSQGIIRDFVAASVTDQFAVLRSRRD